MAKFIVTLTVNESEGLYDSYATENFQVTPRLEQFEVYGESLDHTIKVAKKKLSKLANDPIEIYSINREKGSATLIFSNCEDGLGLTYEIHEEFIED